MSKSGKPRIRIKKPSGKTVEPMMKQARNWTTAQYRAAQYNRKTAFQYGLFILFLLGSIIIIGLWFSGGLGHVRKKMETFYHGVLVSTGFSVKAINIYGLEFAQLEQIKEKLEIREGDPIFKINLGEVKQSIETIDWVESAIVKRLLPNRIVIYVYEKKPVAIWQNGGDFFVLDQNGEIIKTAKSEYFSYLPLVVSSKPSIEIVQFIYKLEQHESIFNHIRALIYIGQRRWNLIFNQDFKILLPEKNIHASLVLLERLEKRYHILKLETGLIDLRFDDRLILRLTHQEGEAIQNYIRKTYLSLERDV